MKTGPEGTHEFGNSHYENWGREDQQGFPYLYCLKFVLEMYSCAVNNDKKNPNPKNGLKYKGHLSM